MMCKLIFQGLLLFWPWSIRRRLLNWVCGFRIHPSARIGRSIILAKTLELAEGSEIRSLTFCKAIDRLQLSAGASIGAANFITGFSVDHTVFFRDGAPERCCELVLEENASITSRHFLDCNGGLYVGAFSTIAGIRTQILTHSVDVHKNTMAASPVRVGKYCFVGTGCILLPGSALPDYAVLGAGALLNKEFSQQNCVYAGCPARVVKTLDHEDVLYFHRHEMRVT